MRHYFEWNQKYIKTNDFYKSEYFKNFRPIFGFEGLNSLSGVFL